jgi:hypothetical protein
MKYLCLGYHEEQQWAAMNPSERDAIVRETLAYGEELRKNGHMLREDALQSTNNAATLRFQSGKISIVDGPFAETKEQLGGIMLLEADGLNHAIQLMSKLPCMRMGGSLEIRPINEQIASLAETP